jgi:Cupin superfamily protein
MTFADVEAALTKGTVIMNAAGAHIPKLAGPSLALTDAVALPCALNLYVTAPGQRTSAPPHTDKQDVCVVQTAGRKSWKVFAVPDPSKKPSSDIFSRGKGDDSLPLYSLSEETDLLVETTLAPGDVLFIPAGFPHTTSTVHDETSSDETSVHLTFGIDHHIWELDYLSVRRLAHRRAGLADALESDMSGATGNPFTGKVNLLPPPILADIMAELPMGLLEEDGTILMNQVADKAVAIMRQVDPECKIDANVVKETVARIRQQGMELLDTHRDMYLAAIDEGRIREAEDAMTAHLDKKSTTMSPERMQRLSLFRVKRFYDQINESKKQLAEWSTAGSGSTGSHVGSQLASNWAFTLPVSVGDQVEADLGGAFFPATVTRASEGSFDVAFFDGDRESGLHRGQLKLLAPPKSASVQAGDVDTSKMTPKQLKRWRKEQEKRLA